MRTQTAAACEGCGEEPPFGIWSYCKWCGENLCPKCLREDACLDSEDGHRPRWDEDENE